MKNTSFYLQRIALLTIPFLLVIVNFATQTIVPDHFTLNVKRLGQWDFFESNMMYAWTHLFAFFPVLSLSFDRRVHYYQTWKYLWKGWLFTALFFIFWDYFKTQYQVWGFNPDYFLGIKIANLPLEECLFFFTFPFCSVFIYECLNHYVKKDIFKPLAHWITFAIIIGCAVLSIIYWSQAYTATTCILVSFGFLYHYLFIDAPYRSRMYFAMFVVILPHSIMDNIWTGAFTKAPLVIYNPDEYMGIFFGAIPVEDFIYGFLLFLMNISFLEYFRKSSISQ